MTAKEEWKSWFTGLVKDWKDEPALITLTILEFGLFLYFQYHVFMKDELLIFKLSFMLAFIPLMFIPIMAHEGTLFLMNHLLQLFRMVVVRPVVWVIYKLVH